MEKASTPTKINHVAVRIKASEDYSYDQESLMKLSEEVIKLTGCNIEQKYYHAFPVQGQTLVYILSESSFVLHTWPEDNLIYLDFLTSDTTYSNDSILEFIKSNPQFIEVKLTDFSNQVS